MKQRKREVVAALASKFDPETGRPLFRPNATGSVSEIHRELDRLTGGMRGTIGGEAKTSLADGEVSPSRRAWLGVGAAAIARTGNTSGANATANADTTTNADAEHSADGNGTSGAGAGSDVNSS